MKWDLFVSWYWCPSRVVTVRTSSATSCEQMSGSERASALRAAAARTVGASATRHAHLCTARYQRNEYYRHSNQTVNCSLSNYYSKVTALCPVPSSVFAFGRTFWSLDCLCLLLSVSHIHVLSHGFTSFKTIWDENVLNVHALNLTDIYLLYLVWYWLFRCCG